MYYEALNGTSLVNTARALSGIPNLNTNYCKLHKSIRHFLNIILTHKKLITDN